MAQRSGKKNHLRELMLQSKDEGTAQRDIAGIKAETTILTAPPHTHTYTHVGNITLGVRILIMITANTKK